MEPMKAGDWVVAGSTVALGAIAIFGPAWADQFKAWWFRPQLSLTLNPGEPDCHRTKMEVRLAAGTVEIHPCHVFRVRVTNTGKSMARKCEVLIEALAVADSSGAYVPFLKYTPVRLKWGSGNDDVFLDINPQRPFFCDFFKIPAAQLQSHLAFFGGYSTFPEKKVEGVGIALDVAAHFHSQPNWLGHGRYRITLAMFAENAASIRKTLYVRWSGQWADESDAIFKECVVTPAAT